MRDFSHVYRLEIRNLAFSLSSKARRRQRLMRSAAAEILEDKTLLSSTLSFSSASGPSSLRNTGLSQDGRYVVFDSDATDLVLNDLNNATDVFLRDTLTNTTTLVSVSDTEVQGNLTSYNAAVTVDGNGHVLVAFVSLASNLVPGGVSSDGIYLRDVTAGTTTLISVDTSGDPAPGGVYNPSIAIDGNGHVLVAFESFSSNLVAGDTNGVTDVFLRDVTAGTTTLVSVDTNGSQGNNQSANPFLAVDSSGTVFVAFLSLASNLVSGDTNGFSDVFLRNVTAETTTLISVDSDENQGLGEVAARPSVAVDNAGNVYVAFDSYAENLVPGDNNGVRDVFLRDVTMGTTTRVSVGNTGAQANAESTNPSVTINSDGQPLVAFISDASNLFGDINNAPTDVFLRDIVAGTTVQVSVDSLENPGNNHSVDFVSIAADSGGNVFVAFGSHASNLVARDNNNAQDVFMRRMTPGDTILISVSQATFDQIVFDPASGRWRLGVSNGSSFTWTNGPKWNPASGWRTFTGDFNGDGLTDGLGITSANAVFLARNNGNGTMTTVSAGSFANETLQYLMVGDFNGDGADDLIVQFATASAGLPGSWYTKSWNGTSFVNSFYGRWEATGWTGFVTGDVNLDGADDIIGFRDATDIDRTNITYGISNIIPGGSRRFVSQFAGALSGKTANVGWTSILVGDWDNDGRADIAARRNDGRFYYGTATGAATANVSLGANKLVPSIGPLFSPSAFTGPFFVGDFNGDGRDDLLSRQSNNKNLWVALSSATAPTSSNAQLWGSWDDTKTWSGAAIGDFNGDGRDDYASVDLTTSHTWVSLSTGSAFQSATDFGLMTGPEALVGPLRISSGIVS